LKEPFASETAEPFPPFTLMEAFSSGAPFWSEMMPEIVLVWANAGAVIASTHKKAMSIRQNTFFLIQQYNLGQMYASFMLTT
jgi:hypothetical protein